MQYLASIQVDNDKRLFVLICVGVIALFYLLSQSDLSNPNASQQPPLMVLTGSAPADIMEVVNIPRSKWQSVGNPANLGFSDQVHWFRFELASSVRVADPLYAEIHYALLDNIEVWVQQQDEFTQYTFGDTLPFHDRPLGYSQFVFPLPDNPEPVTVYIKVLTSSVVKLPVSLWPREQYGIYIGDRNLSMGLFFGLLLVMGISNLFFFVTTRTSTFLYYAGYVLGLDLTVASLNGFGFQYLWPQEVAFQAISVTFLACVTMIFAVLFSGSLLEVKRHSKTLGVMFRMMLIGYAGLMLMSFVISYSVSIRLLLALLGIGVTVIMVTAVWLAIKKVPVAAYCALAWSAVLVSAFTVALDNLGLIKTGAQSSQLLVYGAAIESLMLAFILAISYRRQYDAMLAANEAALEQEHQAVIAKQQLIDLQQRNQEELEYKVEERTLELEIALRELSEVNEELERTSTIDPLTDIRNRRYFERRLLSESRRCRREQTPLALAMIDIDNFKKVNDRYGHVVGDACIKHVAAILHSNLKRESDDVCRYGGEEFTLILPNTDINGAYALTESMRQTVEQLPCQFDHETVSLTISVGVVSQLVFHEGEEHKLLKTADKRLYIAKQQGRNKVIADSSNQAE